MLAAILETPELAAKVIHKCLENGLILFFLLFEGKAMRITPPLTISDEEVIKGCKIILNSIDEVLNWFLVYFFNTNNKLGLASQKNY